MPVVYIDSLDVSVADSWVVPSNKTGTGNGEAKIYVGHRTTEEYKEFFGPTGFRLQCRLRRSDLLRFLDDMQVEYFYPTYPYRESLKMGELWLERRAAMERISDEFVYFTADDQTQIEGPRGYINSQDENYQILRTLPLPGTSIVKVVKLEDDGERIFEFRLMPYFDGFTYRSVEDRLRFEAEGETETRENDLVEGAPPTTVQRLVAARIGQDVFRKGVIKECEGVCAFTLVGDTGLLTAGHIKPWSKSDDLERLDPQNGLVFTPTYDRLFNNGLISFTDRRELLISPLVSRDTRTRLHIAENMEIDIPLLGSKNAQRRDYMEFHRQMEFRK